MEADLGRFSQAVYKKIISDAKQQRFQGFRPGTIPPHLEPTYRAFTMDEVARETILEALQQNNIRPFESARQDMTFENFFIQPSEKKGGSSNKKSKKGSAGTEQESEVVVEKPQWLQFADMKSAIDGGWKVCQSKNVIDGSVVACGCFCMSHRRPMLSMLSFRTFSLVKVLALLQKMSRDKRSKTNL